MTRHAQRVAAMLSRLEDAPVVSTRLEAVIRPRCACWKTSPGCTRPASR
ncbi:hypothetical protein ACR80S_06605 [Halomonas sp. MA07-2]